MKRNVDTLGSLEHIMLLAVMRLGSNAYGMTVRRDIESATGREFGGRHRIKALHPDDCDVIAARTPALLRQVVVDLSAAEHQPRDLRRAKACKIRRGSWISCKDRWTKNQVTPS